MENTQLSKRQWWLSTIALLISTSVPMFVVTARMNILSNIMSEFNGMHLFSITSILGSLTMSITLPISGRVIIPHIIRNILKHFPAHFVILGLY